MFQGSRIGEAQNPGPVTLGTFNPTGLMGKSSQVNDLHHGVYAVQETHLTYAGIRQFKRELSWGKSAFHISHGAPAPPQSHNLRSVGGKQTGVAVLSTYPVRSLNHEWTSDEYSTARCHVSAAYVQSTWLTIGTVYGYSSRNNTTEVQTQTDSLLQGLTRRVVEGAQGLRMIAGDWNLERHQLPQADFWESKGWVEAQSLAATLWNYPTQATCKHTTVKDFLYLSPEMVPLVKDVIVDWSRFQDHAVVCVQLQDIPPPKPLPLWRKPSQIQWPPKKEATQAIPEPAVQPANMQQNQTGYYQHIMQTLEQYASDLCTADGKPKLYERQKGRAATHQTQMVQPGTPPIKPSRKGDVQSQLSAQSLQHTRWTRQLRRLQHYWRCVNSPGMSTSKYEHRATLWGSITRAAGFQGSFRMWWNHQRLYMPSLPPELPSEPAQPDVAQSIFLAFLHEYKQLEAFLMDTRKKLAVQRRSKDPLLIYRDLKADFAEPVQHLMITDNLEIVDKHPCENGKVTIHLNTPLSPDVSTISVNQVPVTPKYLGTTQLQVDEEVARVMGNQVTVHRLIGDPQEILQSFHDEWAPRWQKHEQTTMEHWEAVLNLAGIVLPRQEEPFPQLTLSVWKQAIRNKKKHSAIGPDGLSREDLLRAPDSIHHALIECIHRAELGQGWPSQVVTGIVAALAKTPSAQRVTEFRPITIYSMCYRLWGSVRAKQCLRFLQQLVPSTLMGNIPRRSPKHMWYAIQQVIELTGQENLQAAGGVLDIVKCFNALPRHPVLMLAKMVGIPQNVIIAWQTALQQMTRRFQVRSATGPAIYSFTGLPEGDAMSVVGMVLINMACEVWLRHRFPKCQIYSFVDNIETLTDSAEEAISTVRALTSFCDMLDLQIDAKKTYCWSNSAEGRKHFRLEGCYYKQWAKDLGAPMTYGKRIINCPIQQKITDLDLFWTRLAKSAAPIPQKLRALYVAAWPNIFYGISITTLGPAHFQKLRTLAAKAMGTNQNGSNPVLTLSCIANPQCDPEYYCVHHTIQSFRDFHNPDLSERAMDFLIDCAGRGPPGPCNSTLQALHKLAWSWEGNGVCRDHEGDQIRLSQISKPELLLRTKEAWQQRVTSEMQMQRPTMDGLCNTDVGTTLDSLYCLPPEQQGLLRVLLNGTQFTNEVIFHTGHVPSKQCSFCDHQDSAEHRHWDCEFFQDIREKYPQVLQQKDSLPQCTRSHAWLPKLPSKKKFLAHLSTLPDTSGKFHAPLQVDPMIDVYDIFTDGSCAHPAKPAIRFASWATVLWTGETFWPLSMGNVPGRQQTSLRAEIWGAISALKFVALQDKPSRLWLDNSVVFDTLQSWINHQDVRWDTRKDSDLWYQLQWQYRYAAPKLLAVYKVASHCNPGDQPTAVEAWATIGNNAVDKQAELARAQASPACHAIWVTLCHEYTEALRIGKQLHQMYLEVGKKALQTKMLPKQTGPGGVPTAAPSDVSCDPNLRDLAHMQEEDIPTRYRIRDLPTILNWLRGVTREDQGALWVSFHQLLLAYQLHSGREGPKRIGKCWDSQENAQHLEYSHTEQTQWFSTYICQLAKSIGKAVDVQQRRPPSHVLSFWGGHVRIAISRDTLDSIDSHISRHISSVPARQVRHVRDVPAICS